MWVQKKEREARQARFFQRVVYGKNKRVIFRGTSLYGTGEKMLTIRKKGRIGELRLLRIIHPSIMQIAL